jgi:predicted metal-dependent phosphoesterase TrpH
MKLKQEQIEILLEKVKAILEDTDGLLTEAIKKVIRKGKIVRAPKPGYKRKGNVYVRVNAAKRIRKAKKLKKSWRATKAKRKRTLNLTRTKRKRAKSVRKGQRLKLHK